MKKIICMILLGCVVLSLIVGGVVLWRNWQRDAENKATVYVDDVKLRGKEPALFIDESGYYYYKDYLLIPLESIFDVLDFEFTVDESTGNIYFDSEGIAYVCEFRTSAPDLPEKFMFVSKVEDMGSIYSSDYIQLIHEGEFGWYREIDNVVYLHHLSAQYFLEAFGCEAEVDVEKKEFRIYTN